MNKHINELKYTLFYIFLSWFLSVLIVFIYRDWFIFKVLLFINWSDIPLIITNMFESFSTLINMSFWLGSLFSLLSLLLLILSFISRGLYFYEFLRFLKLGTFFFFSFFFFLPKLSSFFKSFLFDPNFFLLGKLSEIWCSVWVLIVITGFVWIVGVVFWTNSFIINGYIKNRGICLLVLYVLISILSPPDLILTFLINFSVFLYFEILVFIKKIENT